MLIKKPDKSGIVTTTVLNIKIKGTDKKIPDLSGFANKINYAVKISKIEGKYFLTSDFNKFTSNIFHVKKGKTKRVSHQI